MKGRLLRLQETLRSGFWAVPSACVAVAVALALGLVRVDRALAKGFGGRLTFGAGPAGAREVLSDITSSMITFTGLVFSITIVVLQLTSSQFSPRVLRTFLRDRVTQLSLGVFVATFVYAILVLRTVNGIDDSSFVPAISTTVGVVLLLVSVGMFVSYIHHVATAIQVSSIIGSIGKETRVVLAERFPSDGDPAAEDTLLAPLGPPSVEVPAPRSGVVVSLDAERLVKAAAKADVLLVLRHRVGEFVPEGAPLLAVHGDAQDLDVRAVLGAVTQARERTMQQDVAFGLRQLVDVAERALSPGINDPTTAVQALDEVHDLLRRLAVRPLDGGQRLDGDGRLRVLLRQERYEDYLSLALDEVEQYGADALQVQHRLDAMLEDLVGAARDEHRPAVLERIARRSRTRS